MPNRRLRITAILFALSVPLFARAASSSPYSVVVSISAQRTYVYESGRLIRTMVCSTGIPGTDDETPLGEFIIDESGAKRGEWFFSERYGQGAKYWVGFIGGTYLFHSVPMDRNGRIIPEEAAKLGKPASHGCVRLSLEDAEWFYRTVRDGSPLRILADFDTRSAVSRPMGSAVARSLTKEEVPAWLAARAAEYRQKYTLSCEIALTRLSLAIMGVENVGEDEILASIPKGGTNPERFFVCDDIRGGRRNADGSIHWDNYGTHPPVVAAELERRLEELGRSGLYAVRELHADDAALRAIIRNDQRFLGAVVWLVGHPERWGTRPPVNDRGMVLGEHVRFLEPALTPGGDFRLWDPENGKPLVASEAGSSRDLFGYRIVGLFAAE